MGKGKIFRDWLYVEDHVRALVQVLRAGKPGEKYNIGARNERTNLQLVQTICDIVDELVGDRGGRQALIQFVADRPGHDFRYAIDPSKAEQELGWSLSSTDDKLVHWKPVVVGTNSSERIYRQTARSDHE